MSNLNRHAAVSRKDRPEMPHHKNRGLPKVLHPRVKELLAEASEKSGLPPEAILGDHRTKRKAALAARDGIILTLWAEGGAAVHGHRHCWTQSRIAKEVGMDNTTVHHALLKMGVHTPTKHRQVEGAAE